MGLSCWLRLFRPLVSRGRVCPSGCSCGGFAAGALLGRLCRLGLSRVRGLSLAWARLTGRVLLRRLCRRCAFGSAVPLGLGLVLSLRLTLARLSGRMHLRRPFISRRRACPTACCCGAGCPGYGSRRTGVSCWRDGLGPVSFTDVPCPVTEPRVGLFLNWMFALRYALWLNALAARL